MFEAQPNFFLHGVLPSAEAETITQKTAIRDTSARFWVHHSIRLYISNHRMLYL